MTANQTHSISPVPTQRRSRRRFDNRRRLADRRGAAAVEAAICLPLIVLLMLGTLEVTAGLYLRETLSISCFEACRVGTRRRSRATDVLERATEVLDQRNIQGANIEIIPPDFESLQALDQITVRVTAPTAGNSIFIFDNFANRSVAAEVTMVREFDE